MINFEKFDTKLISNPFTIRIYIAGNYDRIEQVCSDYVTEVGLCVNVKKTNYIYSYGEQSGAEIGIISYPRFEIDYEQSIEHAEALCQLLMDKCNQSSATIIDENNQALYIERKGKK